MRVFFIFTIFVVLYFSGCSSTSPINKDSEQRTNIEEDFINRLENKTDSMIESRISEKMSEKDENILLESAIYYAYKGSIKYANNNDNSDYAGAIKDFKTALTKIQKYGKNIYNVVGSDKGYIYGKMTESYQGPSIEYYLHLSIGKSYIGLCTRNPQMQNEYCRDGADPALDKAIKVLKKHEYEYPDPYYHKGFLRMLLLKQVNESDELFNKAIHTSKKINKKLAKKLKINKKRYENILDFRSHVGLGILYTKHSIKAKENNENNEEKKWLKGARKSFIKALMIDVENDHVLNNLGVVEKKLGNYREAIKYYNQALLINPIDPNIYLNKGLLYKKQDKLDLACFNIRIAHFVLDPKNTTEAKREYNSLRRDGFCGSF